MAERRARLVDRHRLSPEKRARSALAATRSVVVLHSTDAVTVFLSVHARADVEPEDVEHELYEERTLVRMLGMRRTLFVVPRELVPIVYAACTRTIAVRERRRLEKMIEDSGLSTRPKPWLTRAMTAALRALEDRGEAFTSDLTKEVPVLAKRLRFGVGSRFEATQSVGSRVLPQLAMEGRIVRGRPRGTWVSGQYRWVPLEAWLDGPIPRSRARSSASGASPELARRLRARNRDRYPLVGWLDGPRSASGARRRCLTRSSISKAPPDSSSRTTSSPPRGSILQPPCSRPSTRRRWAGRSESGTSALTQRLLFDRNGNAGPTVWWDGRVVGGWSQRRDGEIVFRLLEDVGREAVRGGREPRRRRVAAWLGENRFSPGFLPPFQRELAVM